jgi:hypothetical protein
MEETTTTGGGGEDASSSPTTTTSSWIANTKNRIVHASDVAMYAVVLTLAYNFESVQDRHVLESLAEHEGIRCEAPPAVTTTTAATAAISSSSSSKEPPSQPVVVVAVAVVLRDILKHFLRANYQTAWNLLEQYVWPVLRYDPFWNDAQQYPEDGQAHPTPYEIVRNTIRCKAMAQYWKPYHDCPLSRMEQDLGSLVFGGSIGGVQHQVSETVVGLLRQRRQRRQRQPKRHHPHALHPSTGMKSTMTTTRHNPDSIRLDLINMGDSTSSTSLVFPTDTRIDAITQTLVRSPNDEEKTTDTSFHFCETSARVLDHGYAMLVVAACLEHGTTLDKRSNLHGMTTTTSKRRNPSSWNTGGAAVAGGGGIGSHEEDDFAMAGGGNQSTNSSSASSDNVLEGGPGGGDDDDEEDDEGDAAGDFLLDDDVTAAAPIMMVVEEEADDEEARAAADANMQMNPEDHY